MARRLMLLLEDDGALEIGVRPSELPDGTDIGGPLTTPTHGRQNQGRYGHRRSESVSFGPRKVTERSGVASGSFEQLVHWVIDEYMPPTGVSKDLALGADVDVNHAPVAPSLRS